MSKKVLLPTLLVLLLGCQPNNKKKNTLSEEVISDTLKTDTTLSLNRDNKNTKEITFEEVVPDTTINKKLFLENYTSISDFYSNSKSLELVEQIRESPVIIFGSKSNKEYLLAYQYEGNTKNAFSCFEMGYFEDEKNLQEKSNQTEYVNFKTESGIGLGLSLEEVVQKKGEGYKVEESGGDKIMTYSLDNYEDSPFLKRYNMPGYFIQIRLKNDSVKRITFGFNYP